MKNTLAVAIILIFLGACTTIIGSTVTSEGSTNNGTNETSKRTSLGGRAPAKETSE